MPSAEIITIGTEILLGEIVDTNARYIARRLRDLGIDLFRKTTVGDNVQRISSVIQQALERCDIIITTGGLGPTIDDPTRQAVAQALGVEMEYRPELWEQIQARFRRYDRIPTENNRRQAYVPAGASPYENPVGTAPIFIMEPGPHAIIALPGVPREMEYLLENTILPYLKERYHLTGTIKTRVLHTVGVGESIIDDLIGDLEQLSNPTVGLAAHSGQVDVRIAAKAASEAEADALIEPIEKELRKFLEQWIYGIDEENLESVAIQAVRRKGWSLVVVEAGLQGELTRRLAAFGPPFLGGEILGELPDPADLGKRLAIYCQARQANAGLAVAIYPEKEKQDVRFVLKTPSGQQEFSRPYGGPPENAARWAFHHSLDVIRKL
jgi:competence/damage-inducible protein CinA-like protein